MDTKPHHPPASGMALDDVYFVLFRHKWKIILLFLLGLVAAGALYRLKPPDYQSEAKLMIKYVVDNTSPAPAEKAAQMQSTDPQGQSIINTEIVILTSLDVAKMVAEDIGPEKILARFGGSHDVMQAASFISSRLQVEQEARSSVVSVNFKHPDPEMVVPVLSRTIEEYKTMHYKVHQPGGTYIDYFTSTTADLKLKLADVEKALKRKKDSVGILSGSTEDALAQCTADIAAVEQNIRQAQTELAVNTTLLNGMTTLSSGKTATTNASTAAPLKPEAEVPPAVVDEYADVLKRLAALGRQNDELIAASFLPQSDPVKNLQAKIKDAQEHKAKLEADNPGLLTSTNRAIPTPSGQTQGADALANYSNQMKQVMVLNSRITELQSQEKEVQDKARKIGDAAQEIIDLERRKKQVEDELQSNDNNLVAARANDALGAEKAPNIIVVQEPSPPGRNWTKRRKAMGMLAAGGLGLGIAWAFLIEFFLDTSIKRPKDIKLKLGLPLFLTIPAVKQAEARRALTNGRLLLKNGNGNGAASANSTNGPEEVSTKLEIAPWDHNHAMHPYYEALRDRLLGYFEAKNLTHNPKLVAVTGSSKGSGATTLAMGLAASLSETGDGNVLLVDMNQEHGASQHFYKGKPDCGLDDVLESDNRETALVQENLYVVNVNSNSDHLPRILPKRFASLVPKFKASDFDYIIFDMPPISQTSVTLRLAGFMDTTLLVVESEKTRREAVVEAGALLAEAKANVNVVLNKAHTYVPPRLHQDF